MPSVSTKRAREYATSFEANEKLPRSSTNENFKSKHVDCSDSNLEDSDTELNATTDKLNRTHLDTCDSSGSVSDHEMEDFEKKRKPMTYRKTFKIIKPDYPWKLKNYNDENGLRFYSDKLNKIEVI